MTKYAACFLLLMVMSVPQRVWPQNRNLAARPTAEKRVALVIGNASYVTSPLKNPVNDARAMGEKLRTLGFEVILRENLRQKQIGPTLREFRTRLSAGAVALFFYAGHGVQVKGVNYLPSVDAEIEAEEDVPTQSIDVNKVLEVMEEAKSAINLVFLDACRNNPYARSFRSAANGLAKVSAPSGTLISFATRPGSVASDGAGRNGVYTEQLLRHMDERNLAVEQMLKRVVTGVKQATKGIQEPWMEGSIEGDFYFRVGPTASASANSLGTIPNEAALDREFWSSIKDSRNAGELKAYLDRYPDGIFSTLARARLSSLEEKSAPQSPMQIATASPSQRPPSMLAQDLQRMEYLTGTLRKINESSAITIGHREYSIPFSFLDDRQRPIGYAIDLCMRVVDAIKLELKLPNLRVIFQPVTSSNRIPLLQNGTIDMECGSTTNSVARQQQVSFGPTYFVINVTAAVKKSSNINTIAELNGKTVSTTLGTTAMPLIKGYEKTRNINIKEIYGKDHGESFQLLANDRAAAFIMDDILIAGQIANARNPEVFKILPESLRREPYSMMLRKNDPQFKALVDRTIGAIMTSGEIEKVYAKWFTSPVPPRGVNMNFPITPPIREAFRNPNDNGV